MKISLLFLGIFLAAGCEKSTLQKQFEVELISLSQLDCHLPVIRFTDTTGMKAACGFSSSVAMTREIPESLRIQGKHFLISIRATADAIPCTALGVPLPLLVITDLQEKN